MPNHRALQDFHAWPAHDTAKLWVDIAATPCLAPELLAQHMSSLGLTNPSEPTSAHLAAAIVVAVYGPAAGSVISDMEIKKLYNWFKAVR